MSDMQFWKLVGGGSYFWKGVRKKGGSDEPPNPPWLRACAYNIAVVYSNSNYKRHVLISSNDIQPTHQFNSIQLLYSRLNSIVCIQVVHNNLRSI